MEKIPKQKLFQPIVLRYYRWGLLFGWTCLVGLFIVVVVFNERGQMEERARAVAKTVFHRDRHWTTLFGDVYLPITQETEKELEDSKVPLQFVTTTSGTRLALLSPLLVRQALESRADNPFPVKSRMTSLNPSHPENAADPWEERGLLMFETGQTEVSELQSIDGKPHLRFLGALRTEQSCLRCHEVQGYRVGDIRGAVSIAVPLEAFWSLTGRHTGVSVLSLCVLWLVGLGGIQIGSRRLKQRIEERDHAMEERLRDLVERKRAESALAESEERYRRIVDSTQEGIWEIDADGNTTFANRPMAEMLGYTIEEMLGRPMYDFMDDDARREAERNLERRRRNVAEQHDFRLRRKDGSDLWTIMSTNPIVDREGRFTGALGMVIDITQRKATELALAASESRYRTLFESNLAGVYRTTLDGRILECNTAVARILGFASPDELKQARAYNFYFDNRDREEFLAALRESGALTAYQVRLRRKDGNEIWVLENVTLEDEIIQGTIVDITWQRRAQEALHESEKLLRLEKMRTQIAADLHDEIGSTLSSISVFNEMLRQEVAGAPPRVHQLVHRVEENLQAAQDSLHEIVWTINPENDALENILLALQQYAAELLEARGIRFEFLVPERSVAIRLSMEKRRQVYLIVKEALNNLIRHAACTQAFLGVYVDESNLTLTVRDNGKGFQRVAAGSGNGLRNMETRAASIGATLMVSSGEATGTNVTLRVPIA